MLIFLKVKFLIICVYDVYGDKWTKGYMKKEETNIFKYKYTKITIIFIIHSSFCLLNTMLFKMTKFHLCRKVYIVKSI